MLLNTKFLTPSLNDKSIERNRLLKRLQARFGRKLTMVMAPAGYGKTTLIAQWLSNNDADFCWLSLDENDNQVERFWSYINGCIQHKHKDFGVSVGEQMAATPYNGEAVVTAIINELSELASQGKKFVIVLDDFHVIQDHEILRQFTYFIDFLPPGIEVAITSRFEPALPLARWSVKNWLDQLYASDLTFSFEESKSFFNSCMGMALTDSQIENIVTKTEGWIAAIQLTAISLQGTPQEEQAQLSNRQLFANERHFSDYVSEEVLAMQDPTIREFLLDTSCLLKLSAGLCDEIRNRDDSQGILERLAELNLFIIPLDNNNHWFRYHDMFREALLKQHEPSDDEALAQTQRKAIEWLVDHDQHLEAIEQVLLIKDWDLLVTLLEENGNNLIHEGHHLPVLHWLSLLPDNLVDSSPRLLMLRIWALFFSNKIEVIPPSLDELEKLIDQERLDNKDTDLNELIDLHSEISLIRSYLARSRSDFTSASEITQQVLEQISNSNMPLKSVTYYGIGLDSFTKGELDPAREALELAIKYGKTEKKYTTVLSSSGLLGWIFYYQGELNQALQIGLGNQQWIDNYHDPSQPRIISCWQNSALALIYAEKAEFTLAQSYLNPLLKHLETGTEPGQHIIIQYARANLFFAQKEFQKAIDCLDDALQVYQHKKASILFEPPSLASLKSRCLLALGKTDMSEKLINDLDEETINRVPLNFEDINLTKARVFISKEQYELAVGIANRLIRQSSEKRHISNHIQALLLKSIGLFKQDNKEKAQKFFSQSIMLANQGGFISIFLHDGDAVLGLVKDNRDPNVPDHYLLALSQRLESEQQAAPAGPAASNSASVQDDKNADLLEPLSQRELEVLSLIEQGLANKQIANKLSLAPATVKAHIRNIYGKIDAKSRTEALAKARSLGVLT